MLAARIARIERRGIVLVLVLAMLGLLALIGVTFATFSGQSRVNNRNYQQSLLQPQADELFDFALGQLISDTNDIRSVIRGHSLARDMYGTGSTSNGYLPTDPSTGNPFYITGIAQATSAPSGTYPPSSSYVYPPSSYYYTLTTNIASNDTNFFGYLFQHWIMRVAYTGSLSGGPSHTQYLTPPNQTFEILADSGFNSQSNAARTFTVAIIPSDAGYVNATTGTPTILNGSGGTLINPTLGNASTGTNAEPAISQLPGQYLANLCNGTTGNSNLGTVFPFALDGRWLNAFNGPGMGALRTQITINGSTFNVPNSTYGNFRYNGMLGVPGPGSNPAMDEDYDACDLENWFLALQSADGQVMIPSFHRPGVVRYDPNNATAGLQANDWGLTKNGTNFRAAQGGDSLARILRPVAADGHDAATFPDLIPDPTTGKITYDVDNDGDGVTDSVWLDLGYSARTDSSGRLYKPLFAFMVIGLNGRIPLNTAGNLAATVAAPVVDSAMDTDGAGASTALHLGNSTSEIDPTYALQNGFDPTTTDPTYAFTPPILPAPKPPSANASNTQVDNGGIDVRLTQLRTLLSGTRPQNNPLAGDSSTNGDLNYVFFNNAGSAQTQYYMPNGIAETWTNGVGGTSIDSTVTDNKTIEVHRTTQPVPGRWGEAQSIPGVPFLNPNYSVGGTTPQYVGTVVSNFTNPVRAGYSLDIGDLINGVPRDAADDNYNAFDPNPATNRAGEVGDVDLYDAVGALMLPSERMRRWLTPADINGTGRVHQWSVSSGGPDRGGDPFGRVEYQSYFRPPGSPGLINNTTSYSAPQSGSYLNGTIAFGTWMNGVPTTWTSGAPYDPDLTNNLLHGFEAFRFPAQSYTPPGFTPQSVGGTPVDQNEDTKTGVPTAYPSYDNLVNSTIHSDGINEADEMNLYQKNPLLDSPFVASDLEWLYRQQDVDGSSLSSRLQQLAPISFTNAIDGQRRRRLFALDTWDTNNIVWTNDNPVIQPGDYPNGSFTNNSTFSRPVASAGFSSPALASPLPTPTLAQRNKKINLNFPLPVSNDPNEPIRVKWISDTYQLLKDILPPRAVDTPEELAQLSQFVINIVDFRDPDATMTHWINPDVVLSGVIASGTTPAATTTPLALQTSLNWSGPLPSGEMQLDQYGMEFNPVAINEALAYAYSTTNNKAASAFNRFMIELVNTLTQAEVSTGFTGQNPSVLDLGGFTGATSTDPYSVGSWDIVFTGDDPYSRPDPYRGDLALYGNIYGLTPLNGNSFSSTFPNGTTIAGQDVTLLPLVGGSDPTTKNSIPAPTPAGTALAKNYFYVFGNLPPSTMSMGTTTYYEYGALQTQSGGSTTFGALIPGTIWPTTKGTKNVYPVPSGIPANTSAVVQSLNVSAGFDPMTNPGGKTPTLNLYQGVLPGITSNGPSATPPANYQWKVPVPVAPKSGAKATEFVWVCLRRPANPFAPVSATNPMVVVDSMRVPYVDGTGTGTTSDSGGNPALQGTFNSVYSAQRFQPYRGGHAVPVFQNYHKGFSPPATAFDTRYGFSEQTVPPTQANSLGLQTQGIYFTNTTNTNAATLPVYHTLGWANESAQGSASSTPETWDFLPFHDRDFTSVAELMFVPACPPGLFTKQFAEFAPSQANVTSLFAKVTPQAAPAFTYSATAALTIVPSSNVLLNNKAWTSPAAPATASMVLAKGALGMSTPVQPHSFPYLSDKFYYTGFGGASSKDSKSSTVGGYASDGWFKMFEFFEVPSQMIAAIGPVANGTNFDWARQDFKPGLLNLNLIIDEEVYLGLLGKQSITQQNGQLVNADGSSKTTASSDQFAQLHLNMDQVSGLPPGAYTPYATTVLTPPISNPGSPPYKIPLEAGSPPVPLIVSATTVSGAPAYAYPLATTGLLAADPITNSGLTGPPYTYSNSLKASFVQFLNLRHGGSGYMFGFGAGLTGENLAIAPPAGAVYVPDYTAIPAEIPFHSLSFPDINHTIMRPATLPPTSYTDPQPNTGPTGYASDPGVRNPNLFAGYTTQYPPGLVVSSGTYTYNPVYPPAIPARRLFEMPDNYNPNPGTPPSPSVDAPSNAFDSGDPYINNVSPTTVTTPPLPAPGSLPPVTTTSGSLVPTNSVPNLYWPNGNAATLYPSGGMMTTVALPTGVRNPYLGANSSGGATPSPDNRQHPYWRAEEIQRVMNLTTTRTHQFAVWVTIGFFEVTRQGDLGMWATTPQLAFDILGPEIGAANGKTTRYRAFYLVDRLQLIGFNPNSPGAFRSAITYRQRIQ